MNPDRRELFRALHVSPAVLCLPNAWDALSARLCQELGARAVATSSAALAWSVGYPDGECLPRERLLLAVRDLLRCLSVPLSVDLERGYSNRPEEVAALVLELAELGVSGVNLEDGTEAPELLASKLDACRAALKHRGHDLFLNARTDVYLRGFTGSREADTLTRARLYADAGADGLFVPGLCEPAQMRSIARGVPLPLNVWWQPDGGALAVLAELGVRRVSVGPRLAVMALQAAQTTLAGLTGGSTLDLDYRRLNAWFA
jgi:2-methylisocitrate lyase-like PEP mutase family enzyme